MATAQSVINSARYDLVDFVDGVGVGIDFDDVELLNYLNRMIGVLDATLSSLSSDLVEGEEASIDTVLGQNYVDISAMNSGLWNRVRRVYLGNDSLTQVSLPYMRYTRLYRSGNARPRMWALSSNNRLLFPQGADAAHTDLLIYYDSKTADLSLTDSMPYSDIFNEFLREMLVLNAKAKKQGLMKRTDTAFNEMFKRRAMQEEISRGFIPKHPYNYNFFGVYNRGF
jgi:hypothetical protein